VWASKGQSEDWNAEALGTLSAALVTAVEGVRDAAGVLSCGPGGERDPAGGLRRDGCGTRGGRDEHAWWSWLIVHGDVDW
jgi:hypothetical protein